MGYTVIDFLETLMVYIADKSYLDQIALYNTVI